MPFYEYECPHCRYYAEVMQKISDAPLRKCPSCGKGGFKRLISAPVFRLKGSGWYETDFKSDKENKRNLSGGPDREESKPAETKPAETKPDAKDTAKSEAPAAKPVEQAKPATARGSKRGRAAASRTPARKKAGVRKHK